MMNTLANLVIKYRFLIIISVILLTIFLGYSMKNLVVETDMIEYLPEEDPDVVFFKDIGNRYGGNYIAMVAVEADDVFTSNTLSLVRNLTREFENIDGVRDVISLTNILDIKKIEDGIEVGRLVDKNSIPADPEELRRLKEYTLSKDMYTGGMVSSSGQFTVIICRIEEEVNKQVVAARLKEIADKMRGDATLYYGGFPMVMDYMNTIIFRDMGLLVPIIIVVLFLTLYLSFGSFYGVFLPLITVCISVIWSIGMMAITGTPLTMVTTLLPVILIGTGTAYGIHMVNKYYEEISDEKDNITGLAKAIKEVGVPIIMTGVTTFIGFLSLRTSTLSLMQDFGLFTGLGIVFSLILSITLIPAILATRKVKARSTIRNESIQKTPYLERVTDLLSNFVIRYRRSILVISSLLVILSFIGIPRFKTEVNMTNYFKRGSEPRVAEELMRDEFGGSTPVLVHVQGDLKDPFILKEISLIERYLEAMPHVSNARSLADLIAEMNDVMNDRYVIPETVEGVETLWLLIDGQDILDQMIDNRRTQGIIQAKIDEVDTGIISNVVVSIERFLEEDISSDMVVVELGELNQEERLGVIQYRSEKITKMIMLDAKKVGSAIKVAVKDLERLVNDAMTNMDELHLDTDGIDLCLKKIKDYLTGDEAEIEVSPDDSVRIFNSLKPILKGQGPEVNKIAEVLGEILDDEPYDDPESVVYMAESINNIIEDEVKEFRVSSTMDMILDHFPSTFRNNKEFLKDLKADLWGLNERMTAIDYARFREITKRSIPPEERIKVSFRQTGMPIIMSSMDRQLKVSQIQSLGMALILVVILLMIQLRSFSGGLISSIPIALAVIINFGVMCYLGVPLDNATTMIASIAIGIGIDYTIHFTSRFKAEFNKTGDESASLITTIRTTGRAIIINTLTVMLGFLVLMFSSPVPMQRFGWLTASTMIYSALGAMIVIPSVALVTRAKYLRSGRTTFNKTNKL